MKVRAPDFFNYSWYPLLFPIHLFLRLTGSAGSARIIITVDVVIGFILYHAILSPYCDVTP